MYSLDEESQAVPKRFPYLLSQPGSNILMHILRQRNPCPILVAVQEEGDRLVMFTVDQQNYHLAIAVLCAVVWAGAFLWCVARRLQVKGLQYTQTCLCEACLCPLQGSIAGGIQGKQWG